MTRKRPERRGNLSGLLGVAQELTRPSETDVLTVPLIELRPYSKQPRRSFDDQDLAALSESIRQKGILQPLLVRPTGEGTGYEIAAGERRYRASLLAGLSEVPVLVRDFNDDQMLEVGLVENLQRESLSIIDEVEGKLRLIALRLGISPAEAKGRMMVSLRNEEAADAEVFRQVFELTGRESWQSFAKNKVRVLQWPENVLDAMRRRGLPYSMAAVVAAAPENLRDTALEKAQSGVTLQELRGWLREQNPQSQPSALEQEARTLSHTLSRAKWVRSLSREQKSELQKWLRNKPKWLD